MSKGSTPVQAAIFTKYPKSVIDSSAWRQYYQGLDDYYNKVLRWTDSTRQDYGKVAPTNLVDGLIAYADGTMIGWDPLNLAQKGFYRYDSLLATWVYIG